MSASPDIVYLHIPKTAGKSQRAFLADLYGEKNIYWQGSNSGVALDTAQVVGGHLPLREYDPLPRSLRVSMVRSPLDRVVSFFNWIADPDHGKDVTWASRVKLQQRWLERGLIPDSLEQTLLHCAHFCDAIRNTQCRYLSLYGPTFHGVGQTIAEGNWVIALQDDVAQFKQFLTRLLGGEAEESHFVNLSTSPSTDMASLSPGVRERIAELTAEDQKLYDFVRYQCAGLYRNLRDADSLPERAKDRLGRGNGGQSPRAGHVALRSVEARLRVGQCGLVYPRLHLENASGKSLAPLASANCRLGFELYDEKRRCIITRHDYALPSQILAAGGNSEEAFGVVIPRELPSRAVYVRFMLTWNRALLPGQHCVWSEFSELVEEADA